MENDEIITRQAAKIFELEDKYHGLEEHFNTVNNNLTDCQSIIAQIYTIVGCEGHPANLPSIIKKKLKKRI